jgi:hypothetical protein
MTRHHLTDTELLALHLGATRPQGGPADTDGDAHDHMAGCATCRARGRAVTELLDDVTRATAAETDALFSADMLARQHARIMGRVAHECRSARIISFPAASPAPVRPARGGTRWVAAAVAAGVILGIVGQHVTERIARGGRPARVFQPQVAQVVQVVSEPGVAVRAVSASDDEFYGQVELAFGSSGPAALRPLDVLTPRVSDVRE